VINVAFRKSVYQSHSIIPKNDKIDYYSYPTVLVPYDLNYRDPDIYIKNRVSFNNDMNNRRDVSASDTSLPVMLLQPIKEHYVSLHSNVSSFSI
jgi:hypothetical protein